VGRISHCPEAPELTIGNVPAWDSDSAKKGGPSDQVQGPFAQEAQKQNVAADRRELDEDGGAERVGLMKQVEQLKDQVGGFAKYELYSRRGPISTVLFEGVSKLKFFAYVPRVEFVEVCNLRVSSSGNNRLKFRLD